MAYKLTPLGDGVQGLFIENPRFKTTLLSFHFYLPLRAETVAENALLPYVLTSCSAQYPDFSKLNYKLHSLYGATLSTCVAKVGDFQELRLSISVIDDAFSLDDTSTVGTAAELLSSLLFAPALDGEAFRAEDVEREKRQMRERIASEESDKRLYARSRLTGEMFAGDPYGLSKFGAPAQVDAITPAALFAAWQRLLQTAFVRVQIVGRVLPRGVFERVAAAFREIPRADIPDLTQTAPATPAERVREVTETQQLAQGKLVLGFSCGQHGLDRPTMPLFVCSDLFGGGPYSRLFANVREKLSLCYYCSASLVKSKGLLLVDSGVELANADRAREEILRQLDAMRAGEFSDADLEASKRSVCEMLRSYDDSPGTLDLWFANRVADPAPMTPAEVSDAAAAVTREAVRDAARGVKLHTVYLLRPEEGTEA